MKFERRLLGSKSFLKQRGHHQQLNHPPKKKHEKHQKIKETHQKKHGKTTHPSTFFFGWISVAFFFGAGMGAWKLFFPREFCWQDAAKNVDKPHEELLKSCEAQRAKVPFGGGN